MSNLKAAVMLLLFCTACANNQPVVNTNVTIDFPLTATIESVEQADTVLAAVGLARAQIDWRYRQKERICYSKFFMNSCIAQAKDQQRIDLARVKKSEVAANFFKRNHTVEEMDRALVEKNPQHLLPGAEPESEINLPPEIK